MTDDDALAVRANLVLALVVHAGAGFFWLFAVYFGAAAIGGVTVALLWVLGAIVLSVTAGLEMARERRRPARVWWLTFRWWLQTFVSPIFVALLLLGRRAEPAAEPRKASASRRGVRTRDRPTARADRARGGGRAAAPGGAR
jgi:hypothetical protein